MRKQRVIQNPERKQRGCLFCLDSSNVGHVCPHEVCPYVEMDGFTKYTDYLKSTGGDTLSRVMNSAGITGCYTARSTTERP